MPRDAFPGYDEPVNIEGDPEEVLRALLADDPGDQCPSDEADRSEESDSPDR